MPTLSIAGKRVKVGDEFLKLSAEDQQKTVNEIAASFNTVPAADASPTAADLGWKPGMPITPEVKAAFLAHAGDKLTPEQQAQHPDVPSAETDTSLMAQLAAGSSAGLNAIPIAGPKIMQGLESVRGAVKHMTPEQVHAERVATEEANPAAATTGAVAGTVLPFVAAGAVPYVSTVLGLDASLPLVANMGIGAASQAAISALDATQRGEDPGTNALLGAAGGAAGPFVGAALSGAGKAAVRGFKVLTGQGASAAEDLIGSRIAADIKAGKVLSTADQAYAQANNIPIVNADRYGANVRGLVRDAGVADPTAKQMLAETTTDRFLTQNQRAADWIKSNAGAPTDVHAARQALDSAGKAVNDPAYKAAYTHPDAAMIMTPEIEQLMGSTDFQKAIKGAVKASNNNAALTGTKPIPHPFVVDPKTGDFRIRMSSDDTRAAVQRATSDLTDATMSDDASKIQMAKDALAAAKSIHTDQLASDAPAALPSLEFWDQVQRQLRQRASAAGRQGKNFDAMQYGQMRTKLNDVLDATVPEFNTARRGAAAAFGADDALEAGQKFATAKMSDIPDAAAQHAKFSPAEKKLFATGFASSLIDKVSGLGANTNLVTNKIFTSPEAKAQIELAMGKKALDNLEPFLRVENTMNMLKTAVQGGSDTVAKLIGQGALSYGAAGAFGGSGWDPRHWSPKAMLIAGGLAGAKAFGMSIDKKVLQETARLLASNDPTLIQQAVKNGTRSAKTLDAVKAIEHGIAITIRGGAPAIAAASQTGTTE